MSPVPSSKAGCPQEASVLRAARSGQWDDALEAHAAACPACGEVAVVTGGLRTLALETDDHTHLPDAYLVWLKAKLTQRQVASQRASKPWDMAEALGQVVAAAVLAGWLLAELSSIYQRVVGWMPIRRLDDWAQGWSLLTPAVSVPSSVVVWTLIGLICLVTLMAAPLFSED